METGNKCCFTGYRPNKFRFQLEANTKDSIDFDNALFETLLDLTANGVNTFYCGMAMGFDIIAAETVLYIKKIKPKLDIKLICAVPFINQSSSFSPSWKDRYDKVLASADKTVLVSDVYYKGCYFARNKYMVDSSDIVLTYFDGKSGGTKNTLDYAQKIGRKIINLAEPSPLREGGPLSVDEV